MSHLVPGPWTTAPTEKNWLRATEISWNLKWPKKHPHRARVPVSNYPNLQPVFIKKNKNNFFKGLAKLE